MKVLLDSNGIQAAIHIGKHPDHRSLEAKGKRLFTFLSIIKYLGCEYMFTYGEGNEITDDILQGCSLLVITTRMPRLPEPSRSERKVIKSFVQRGGSLLVMSNHPWPNMPNPIPDFQIASCFKVLLRGPIYPPPGRKKGLTEIRDDDIYPHSITNGLNGPIVFNNGCRISIRIGDVIAKLPHVQEGSDTFAVAIDRNKKRDGRVVVTADSGFIGEPDTDYPYHGLIDRGDNINFIRNVFEWLLNLR